MKPAIIIPAISVWVEETRQMIADLRDAEAKSSRIGNLLDQARQSEQVLRMLLGRKLLAVRDQMPRRGTRENGWGAFLDAIELDDSTSYRYIELAKATSNLSPERDRVPTYAELGLDNRKVGPEPPNDLPDPTDDDAPHDVDGLFGDPPAAPVEVDRNTWCTPEWLTDVLGDWDLDPCANERSHVKAARDFRLEQRGEDGLFMASSVDASARVFINPPYGRGQVIQWIRAYAHTRFCFLLKFDPSTEWFGELIEHTSVVLIPKGTRIEFEAPEGVPPEQAAGVQFPHALFYARSGDARTALRKLCFPEWRIR